MTQSIVWTFFHIVINSFTRFKYSQPFRLPLESMSSAALASIKGLDGHPHFGFPGVLSWHLRNIHPISTFALLRPTFSLIAAFPLPVEAVHPNRAKYSSSCSFCLTETNLGILSYTTCSGTVGTALPKWARYAVPNRLGSCSWGYYWWRQRLLVLWFLNLIYLFLQYLVSTL